MLNSINQLLDKMIKDICPRHPNVEWCLSNYYFARWKHKYHDILARDQWRCCQCGSDYDLDVFSSKSLYRLPEQYLDRDLLTLCLRCAKNVTKLDL